MILPLLLLGVIHDLRETNHLILHVGLHDKYVIQVVHVLLLPVTQILIVAMGMYVQMMYVVTQVIITQVVAIQIIL